ncbi:hypothetical protein JHS3_01310 [Jeongeupia sp. HS-3]|uniref:hypothetical protein n=1 Tax=Jeongeupia sp. HS-3 TaxID=1009682 RepID=UPI0018A4FE85|nr:hypothetical protein [Jeongeupia sp. HS-3]BCL74395.1 hypothetical protein JHS3_01310 [Jeongeupia sp. HS-3]
MSASAYKDHPVRALVSQILEMQAAPEFAEPSVASSEQYAFARDKVFAIAHAINELLHRTPAELTSTHALSQLQNGLQTPLSELTAFLANKNPGHLSNAAAQFDQNVLPHLWGFVPQLQNLSQNSFSHLLESQATVSRESIRQLGAQRDDLAARLHELTTQAETQAARLDTLAEGAAKERAEAVATVAKLEQLFAQKETDRASIFETAVSELRKDFKVFENESRIESAALITNLEDQRTQAARIVQVVGNIGVTGNYQQIANTEATQANFWRWVTVAIFSTGVAVAAATFIKFWGQPFSSENAWSVAIRLLYALAITAPAWYTARESARHRTNSDRARQTELELASIGPFIELMPEEKKVQIREQLTPSYFGKTVEAHTANNPLDAAAVKDLAIELVKALKK